MGFTIQKNNVNNLFFEGINEITIYCLLCHPIIYNFPSPHLLIHCSTEVANEGKLVLLCVPLQYTNLDMEKLILMAHRKVAIFWKTCIIGLLVHISAITHPAPHMSTGGP